MKNQGYACAWALAAILLAGAGCASTTTQEGAGEYVDDSIITSRIKAAIFHDPALKSAEINVETFKGEVQLSGFVGTQSGINRAVEVAWGVPGVHAVRNDMRSK